MGSKKEIKVTNFRNGKGAKIDIIVQIHVQNLMIQFM